MDKQKLRKQQKMHNKKEWFRLKKDMFQLPTVKVILGNSLKYNALLDSGSTTNIIHKAVFEELKAGKQIKELFNSSAQCSTATGERMLISGVCKVKVKMNNFSWYEKFLVADHLSRDVILGTSFMNRTGMVINLRDCKYSFKFNEEEIFHLNAQVNHTKVTIRGGDEIKVGIESMTKDILTLIEEFPTVFTNEIGQTLDFEYELKVKDSTPVSIRPYPLSPPKLKIMQSVIDDLLKKDIIERSFSSYSSPAFLVRKPNSEEHRLVINYSQLNQKLERVNVPIGDLQGSIQYLQGAKVFTVLDLNSSFYQIKLSESSKYLTGFSTPFSLYNFKRIPFGLHCGSGLLSGYLDKVLGDIKFKYVLNYVDDLIIYSQSHSEHLDHLREVITRLKEANLTVKPSKVMFAAEEISYLGYLVSHNTIALDPERTKAITSFPLPKSVRSLSRFIGMVSYFSKFIPNYASICANLNDMRKKGAKFKWDEEKQVSFDKLKEAIANPPVLRMANFDKEFILQCDASGVGCGACLFQEYEGERYPIAYYSRKFSKGELMNTVYEKEALSVVYAIDKFRSFLEVQPFLLEVDNQALSWVLSHHRKLGKIGRWVERILSLPFRTKHITSSNNKIADCLSRMFEGENKDKLEEMIETEEVVSDYINSVTEYPVAFTSLKEHQSTDEQISEKINKIKQGENLSYYYVNRDVLMYKRNNKDTGKIVLPKALVNMVLKWYHSTVVGSHLGYYKTLHRIRRHFYWESLYKDIREYVKNCLVCLKSKQCQKKYEGPIISDHANKPMTKLYIDILGELPRTVSGNKYIIIAVDDFTKYVWIKALPNAKTKSIVKALESNIFQNYGCPRYLVSDRASYFRSDEFKRFNFKYGIDHVKLITYRPQGNNSERYVKQVKQCLVAYHNDANNKWDTQLSNFQFCLNTAKSEVHKKTPFELVHTFEPNTTLSNLWSINDLIDVNRSDEEIKASFNDAFKNLKLASKRTEIRRKQDDKDKHPFTEFSRVLLKTHPISSKAKQVAAKLQFKWQGVFRILYFVTPVSVILQKEDDFKDIRKAHIAQLKLYKR